MKGYITSFVGYTMKRWSMVRDIVLGEVLILLLAFLWYDSLWWGMYLQPFMIPYKIFLKNHQKQKRSRQYEKGFYDFLQSLLPSLQAGYSLENACYTAYKEIREMEGEQNSFVIRFRELIHGLEVHIPVEELFYDLARDTGNEEIRQFAVILEILKNMGGNSVEVLRNSMQRIQKKMETAEEIRTVLSGKIYEKNLMLLMPFLMIFYLRITNVSYMESLYHTIPGQMIMSVSLAGIIACFYWTEHIMKISF